MGCAEKEPGKGGSGTVLPSCSSARPWALGSCGTLCRPAARRLEVMLPQSVALALT